MFVPCEKVIVARDDNSINLIGLMQGFKGGSEQTPTNEEPTSVPLRWSTLALWVKTHEDEGKTYEQQVELLSPTGKVLLSQTLEFVMTKKFHRNTGRIFGFPVAGFGDHVLRLSLRTVGDNEEFTTIAEFPLPINADQVPRTQDSIVGTEH